MAQGEFLVRSGDTEKVFLLRNTDLEPLGAGGSLR